MRRQSHTHTNTQAIAFNDVVNWLRERTNKHFSIDTYNLSKTSHCICVYFFLSYFSCVRLFHFILFICNFAIAIFNMHIIELRRENDRDRAKEMTIHSTLEYQVSFIPYETNMKKEKYWGTVLVLRISAKWKHKGEKLKSNTYTPKTEIQIAKVLLLLLLFHWERHFSFDQFQMDHHIIIIIVRQRYCTVMIIIEA